MTNETIEIISAIAFCAIPVGAYTIGLGYMLWKGM